jgi:hypothetical protein
MLPRLGAGLTVVVCAAMLYAATVIEAATGIGPPRSPNVATDAVCILAVLRLLFAPVSLRASWAFVQKRERGVSDAARLKYP